MATAILVESAFNPVFKLLNRRKVELDADVTEELDADVTEELDADVPQKAVAASCRKKRTKRSNIDESYVFGQEYGQVALAHEEADAASRGRKRTERLHIDESLDDVDVTEELDADVTEELVAGAPEEADAANRGRKRTERLETDVDSIYTAAVNGEIGFFKDHPECIDRFESPDKNSVLHVFITAKSHPNEESNSQSKRCQGIKLLQVSIARKTTGQEHPRDETEEFLKEILRMRSDLLQKTNGKDEIPLHIAARHGHSDVVETLLKWCRKDHENDLEKGNGAVRDMMMMTNKAKDTALHEAVRYNHIKVVKALTKGNLNVSYVANLDRETPLYLAVERGYADVVNAMLKETSSWAHGGPNGRTTLHAAVLHNSTELTTTLLKKVERKEMLTQQSDEKGRIPLHYAAYFGYVAIVKRLLKEDKSSACIQTTTEKMTAIHLAASRGKLSVMRELISSCPRCCELVDRRGWNVVHFAVVSENKQVVDYVLSCPFLRNLINEKNSDGNAPLHLLIDSGIYMSSFIRHPSVDRLAFNAKNLNCLDIISSKEVVLWEPREAANCLRECGVRQGKRVIIKQNDWKEDGSSAVLDDNRHGNERNSKATITIDDRSKVVSKGYSRRKDEDKDTIMKQIKNARESHLIVATLIATVSFAAGFTMPGGYKSDGPDEGGAILIRSKAFQTFVITNTVSMMLSSAAVLAHFLIAIIQDKKVLIPMFNLALTLTFLAMIAMVIAFISGTYAVLVHLQALAISTCVLACSFFGFYYYPLDILILELLIMKIRSCLLRKDA